MSADPTLVAALGADNAWPFCAVKIELPAKTLRLLDGSGIVTVGSETYTGSDSDFGTISAVKEVEESMDRQAPELQFVFSPSDAAAAVDLVNPAMQGSRVTIMIGCANPETGFAIGTPEVIFLGEVDVPTLRISEGERQVEFTVVSVFERFFAVDEGERATDGFHQSRWPGELGLSMVTGTEEKLWWGAKAPAGSTGAYPGVVYDYSDARGLYGR